MPRSARDFPPRMVYVLPVPVAPYAKIVTLIPLNNCFTVGETFWDQLQGCSMGSVQAYFHCQKESVAQFLGHRPS